MESPKDAAKSKIGASRSNDSDIGKKISRAHTAIKNQLIDNREPSGTINIAGAYEMSQQLLAGYATLDLAHYVEIQALANAILAYSKDRSRRRPLNIVLHAEPGSGKSHFVKCLAKQLSDARVKEIVFNTSSMRGVEDLAHPIDAVRDIKVSDQLPLLFLDEFDSKDDNFAALLPLLWDGEVTVGSRLLQSGKMIVVLAGSGKRIDRVMRSLRRMKGGTGTTDGKLKDLLTRINGGELTIPPLDEVRGGRDRRVDKICLAISLLRNRFGRSLTTVPWALLRFIVETKFRHGARSVSTLVDQIGAPSTTNKELRLESLALPFYSVDSFVSSSLVFHIRMPSPEKVVARWQSLARNTSLVTCAYEDTIWTRFIRNEPLFRGPLLRR